MPVAYEGIVRVHMRLALVRRSDDTFGRPHLPSVDALVPCLLKKDVS